MNKNSFEKDSLILRIQLSRVISTKKIGYQTSRAWQTAPKCFNKFKTKEFLYSTFDNHHSSLKETPSQISNFPGQTTSFHCFGGTGVAHDSSFVDALQNTGQAEE